MARKKSPGTPKRPGNLRQAIYDRQKNTCRSLLSSGLSPSVPESHRFGREKGTAPPLFADYTAGQEFHLAPKTIRWHYCNTGQGKSQGARDSDPGKGKICLFSIHYRPRMFRALGSVPGKYPVYGFRGPMAPGNEAEKNQNEQMPIPLTFSIHAALFESKRYEQNSLN